MDIKQLNTFLTLSKVKSFTRTAELLGYAQSSITAQVKQLEAELNAKLFERIGKSVSLTSAGKALIPYATQIMLISSSMREAVSSTGPMKGSITIGAAESICIYRLPRIIRHFKLLHPHAEVYLKLLTNDHVQPMLSDNAIDLAFTIGDRLEDESLLCAFETPEEVLVLSPPAHPLASKPAVVAQDFADEAFILTESGCNYRRCFETDMLSSDCKVKVILETGSIQAIKEMSMSGLGLCVLPQVAVTKELQSRGLVALPYEHHYDIWSQLVYHKDKWISPLLRDFIEIAKVNWCDGHTVSA